MMRMQLDKSTSRIEFGIYGGILGGLIAIFGFWLLSPATDSLILFILLRVVIGAIVAMIIGPFIMSRFHKNESD